MWEFPACLDEILKALNSNLYSRSPNKDDNIFGVDSGVPLSNEATRYISSRLV